jgi:general secretion pathway protein F
MTMAEFSYKALDRRKQFVSGQLQAASMNAAVEQLIELGYLPLSTAASVQNRSAGWKKFIPRPTVSKREITILLQDLALLLRSGLPLDDGLRLLTDNTTSAMARVIGQLRKVIGSGGNFADALQSQPTTALPDLVAVVKSAEAAGNLEQVLSHIAQERLKQERVSAKIRAAVRYPAFLLIVSVAVLVFFLIFVVPQFGDVVRDFGARPDPLVANVMAISDGLRQNGNYILGAGLVLAAVALMAWRTRNVRPRVLSFFSRLPGIRGVAALRRTTHFCRGLGLLLANGVTLTDALRLLSDAHVGDDRLRVISDHIRRGGRLVDAIAETNFVPPLAARMLRVGEESGSLDVVATRCAEYYEAKLTEQIDKLAGIVGPAAIVFISALVGTLIVSVMSTLLSINQMAM